ncbi:MAG: MFS transporter [Candidatus Cryptobacteroides sp.]|nr:MFS transporter [Candidatus Cryptobacteroides sp.]
MSKNKNLPAIIVMFALFFMIAFVTNFAGSMGVIVTKQFGASKALSQLGTLANFIAYACMGIPAGIILKRKGYKFTALAAVIVGLVGVAIQWISGPAQNFAVYVAGAFVAGFSMCMLNIVVNPMLNTLGGGGNEGNRLIQLGGSCNSIGGTIAPILLGYLVGGSLETATVKDAAPAMILAMAIFALAAIIIALTKIPEPHMETPEEKAARKAGTIQKDPYGPLSFRHFILGAIAIFFYVGIEVGIPNTANVYFSEIPWVGPALTGTMIGAYWFCMMLGRLAGGAVGGKVSPKSMLAGMSILAIVFLLAFIFTPESANIAMFGKELPIALIFIVLCGLCTSVMWGSIFNLATEGLGKYTATASGIFMTLVCGGGIIPFLQNLLADQVGSIESYWLQIACLCYLVFYALVGSKNVNTNIKVD